MPQNPCVIATKTPTADVLIFDYTKHPSKPGNFDWFTLFDAYLQQIRLHPYLNFVYLLIRP